MFKRLYYRLIDFLTKDFEKPVGSIPGPNSFYLSICCIIKDENEYLKEWMEYHLKIGVQHFFIYDNESKIPVINTLDQLNLSSYATVVKTNGKVKQIRAYMNCIKEYGSASQWIAIIDTDEFIVPKQPLGDLAAFLKDYEAHGAVGINWQLFGSNGHVKKTNKPQLESFLMRSEEIFHVNRHIKSIVQPKYVKDIINAHAFTFVDGKCCVNENFLPVEEAWVDVSVNKAQINHYYCRSAEEYENKIKRGCADNRRKRSMEDFHYHDKDSNKVEDSTILEVLKSV